MDISNFLPYGSGSNAILMIIGLCSIISFGILIERLIYFKKADSDTNSLLLLLRKNIEEGDLFEAIKNCEVSGGAIARVLTVGLKKHNRSQEQIESALEIAGMMEIAALERNAKILSVIAHLSPLIGLLGTVIGFIQAFSEMKMSGLVDIAANQIGEAMEYALITTAAGLLVAIPSVIAYNYLVSRIDAFVLEMHATSSEVVDLLMHREEY